MNLTKKQSMYIYIMILISSFLLGGLMFDDTLQIKVTKNYTVKCPGLEGTIFYEQNFNESTEKVCGYDNKLRLKEYDLNLSKYDLT